MQYEKETIGLATLYRGDSLALLRAGIFGKIGAIVTDPPYGIRYQYSGGAWLHQRVEKNVQDHRR